MLAESPIRVAANKQSIEVLAQHAATSDASVLVYKQGIEVLRKTPEKIDVSKQSVEVMSQFSANAAEARLFKFGLELLIKNLTMVDVSKQSVEVLAKFTTNSSPVKVVKMGLEVLFRRSPILVAPAALPSYWDVFTNNWTQDIAMETAYDTDVSRSSDTITEDRRGRRDRPYRTLSFKWTGMSRTDLDRLLIYMRKFTKESSFVPLYQDLTEITQYSESGVGKTTLYCDPSEARMFINQRIAVVQLDEGMLPISTQLYEIASVEVDHLVTKTDLTQDYYPSSSVIFPCMDHEMELSPEIIFHSDQTADVALQVDETTASTALPPLWTGTPEDIQVYNDIPVFSWEPDWTTPPRIQYKREGSMPSKGRGIEPYTQGARYRAIHHYMLRETRSAFWPYLRFFDSRRGRKRPFWHIDMENIWRVSNINGVFVEIFEFGDFTEFQEDFDYVGIVTKGGDYYVREVLTIQSVLGVYRLTVDESLPVIDPSDVLRVSRARLSRFQKDVLSESWRGNKYVQIPVDIIELLEENDVEMT